MRRDLVAVVAVASIVTGVTAAPSALAKPKPCKHGTTKAKVRGRATCLPRRIALPAPAKIAPGLAQLNSALALTEVGLSTRTGKRVAPLAKRVGHSWTTVRGRLLKATAAAFTRIASSVTARASGGADPCTAVDIVSQGGSFGTDNGKTFNTNDSFNTDGVNVSMGITSGGDMQIGLQTKANGNSYTFKYDSGQSDCTKHTIPQCPQADGSLNAFGTKGKVGFSTTVTRDGKVLSKRSYAKTTTVETKGQVADDAKLDYLDVRYGENTVVESDGVRYTSNGTRLVRVDMRSGSYGPAESVSLGSGSVGGDLANLAGEEADANDFAAFLNQTINNYRQRESAWQTPNTCATATFNPAKNTKTVHADDTGTFTAQVQAKNGGGTTSKARWTLSGEQNGTFTPTSSSDPAPSFSYTVTSHPSGPTLSASVRATSPAGVAEDVWSQKIEDRLNTINGNFTGHATNLGVIYDWTGTATFKRLDIGADVPGPGGAFQLESGQATVTVSGAELGSGCNQSGTSTIGLFGQSPWTVLGTDKPFSYNFIVGFLPDRPQATNFNCADATQNGMPAGIGSMPTTALQSGTLGALSKTTDDLYTYAGSASDTGPGDGQTESWTWTFTGTP